METFSFFPSDFYYHQIIIKKKFNVIRSPLSFFIHWIFRFHSCLLPFHFETFWNTLDTDFRSSQLFWFESFHFSVDFVAFLGRRSYTIPVRWLCLSPVLHLANADWCLHLWYRFKFAVLSHVTFRANPEINLNFIFKIRILRNVHFSLSIAGSLFKWFIVFATIRNWVFC